ncbi:MAG: type VII secretion protein EccB, partial [Mycobacterium sp.]
TANRVALAPGTGYFVQATGQPGAHGAGETPATLSTYWISDTGVRYGVATEGDALTGDKKTLAALAITSVPLPIPWSMLSQFAPGPTLSRNDALLAHDTLTTAEAQAPAAVLRENP